MHFLRILKSNKESRSKKLIKGITTKSLSARKIFSEEAIEELKQSILLNMGFYSQLLFVKVLKDMKLL